MENKYLSSEYRDHLQRGVSVRETAAEIQAAVDDVIADVRPSIGLIGNVRGFIYAGSDGKFVTAMITDYEAELVPYPAVQRITAATTETE